LLIPRRRVRSLLLLIHVCGLGWIGCVTNVLESASRRPHTQWFEARLASGEAPYLIKWRSRGSSFVPGTTGAGEMTVPAALDGCESLRFVAFAPARPNFPESIRHELRAGEGDVRIEIETVDLSGAQNAAREHGIAACEVLVLGGYLNYDERFLLASDCEGRELGRAEVAARLDGHRFWVWPLCPITAAVDAATLPVQIAVAIFVVSSH
jgi:hypothetical protein